MQVQDVSKGMAGSQADPAALLHVLMKHGRMAQAATLALQYLRAWQTEVRLHVCHIVDELPAHLQDSKAACLWTVHQTIVARTS